MKCSSTRRKRSTACVFRDWESQLRLVAVIGRLDDARVALRMSSGIPVPLVDVVGETRTPIQRDDALVVDVLDQDSDVVRSLEDLRRVVVAGTHGWHTMDRKESLLSTIAQRTGVDSSGMKNG